MNKKSISIVLIIVFLVLGAIAYYSYFFLSDQPDDQNQNSLTIEDSDRTGILENACGPTDAPVIRIRLTEAKIEEPIYPIIDIFMDVEDINDLTLGKNYIEVATICSSPADSSSCVQVKIEFSFIEVKRLYALGTYTIYKETSNEVVETGNFYVKLDRVRPICG